MWATSPGARPWSVRSITATSGLLAVLLLASPAPPLAAGGADPVGRILRAAADYGAFGALDGGEMEAAIRRTCGAEALCAAQRLVVASGGRARLEPVRHPDSDTIRWVETAPSVTAVVAAAAGEAGSDASAGRDWIVLDGFGRMSAAELEAALAGLAGAGPPRALGLDLRGNAGGDFGRMLRIAALFTGKVSDALYLIDENERMPVSLDPLTDRPPNAAFAGLTVLVGPGTASSAEILAALLQRYAGAVLVGERTVGKDYLTRVIAVDHDWRLLLPAERVEVPGVTLTGGLRPATPTPGDAPPVRPQESRS